MPYCFKLILAIIIDLINPLISLDSGCSFMNDARKVKDFFSNVKILTVGLSFFPANHSAVDGVYDHRDRTVARYVGRRTETVHGNVGGDHQSDHIFVEPEHRLQQSDRSHDGSARYARCGDHRDTQQQDETRVGAHRNVQPGEHHHRERAGDDLHHRAREVDRGAERDDERRRF